MKKYITIVLITILLFNVIISTPVSAISFEQMMQQALNGMYTQNTAQQFENTGTAATGIDKYKQINGENTKVADRQEAKSAALNNDQDSFIAAAIAGLLQAVVQVLRIPLDYIANNFKDTGTGYEVFTIEKLLYGEYPFFNINYFNLDASSNGTASPVINTIKQHVASWYYGIRTIAIIASLCILVYIAIKMAISTVTQEKIKYKKMLTNWFVALVILFLLHYFMVVIIYLSEMLVSLLKTVQAPTGLELQLYKQTLSNYVVGWEKLGMTIMLLMLTLIQIKFFIIYLKRLVFTGFIIAIAPLITITYPIDKADDNVTQSFNKWRSEFLTLVFIQPLHVLLFMIIFVSAGEIMKVSLFLAVLLLWVISKTEAILRNMFNLNNAKTIRSLKETKIFGSDFLK